MGKKLNAAVKTAAVVGGAFAGASWYMFASFIKRQNDKASELETQADLINEKCVKDEYRMLDIKGLKWKQAHMDIHEKVEITSDDGLKLAGHYFDQGADKTVLVVHGITAWHGSLLFAGSMYYEKGYNVLAVDQRAHGESEGTYRTMGYKESDDVIAWAEYLVQTKGQKKIIMHGVSMGAATVMVCSGCENLPEEVVGIAEDCGFTSIWDMMSWQLRNGYHIPFSFPFMNLVKWYCEHIGQFKVDEKTPVQMVEKAKVPMVFIHGTADHFVPYSMADELYHACGSEKEIFRVEGAGHAMSCMKNPEEYRNAIEALIHKAEG
ncbi:MAG: alpha/beta hydrolase [Hespellia sp.]|nr:alpha/beta hydrolase [Hespellia sp.]